MADGIDEDVLIFPPLSSGREREQRAPSPRKAWLHLATAISVSSGGLPSPSPTPGKGEHAHPHRKRPQPLTTFVLGLESREDNGAMPGSANSNTTAATAGRGCDANAGTGKSAASDATRFPFISPVEPILTLARFNRSMNKVYIPLEDDEELEVGEAGFRALNGAGSNFALLGTPGSSLLGGGAFGQVYKALHFPTMRRVAIKKIPKDFGRTHEYANSFARELRNLYHNVQGLGISSSSSARATPKEGVGAQAQAQEGGADGHCPYLLTLYDAYIERSPTNLCLVLEYMEGGSLEQLLATEFAAGCDDEGFLREVAHNVLKGLHHLHQRGYLHQDVKPGNVLLTAQRFAKLADFGLTVAVNSTGAEATGGSSSSSRAAAGDGATTAAYTELVAVGTARYWPPELWGAEKRRDPQGRGDVWGLGLTVLALVNGREPLHNCTARSQAEIELFEACKEAAGSGRPSVEMAEERGILSRERLSSLSPALQDFLNMCLLDLPQRPTAAELLQHAFIKDYCRAVGSRQRELDEAVKALKTHIQIHKEWKITPQMVELLAWELRIPSSDLREYLDVHLDMQGLLLSSFRDARASPSPSPASAAGEPDHGAGSCCTPGPATGRSTGRGEQACRFDLSFSSLSPRGVGGVSGATTGTMMEAAAGTTTGSTAMGRTAASAVTATEPEADGVEVCHEGHDHDEEEEEEESLQATLLRQYDELDRLRTEVIPPLEDVVEELRAQLRSRDERLAEADEVIADLRRRLRDA